MKKIITALMILTLTAAVFPMNSAASVNKKDAYKAYKKELKERKKQEKQSRDK